MTVSRALPLVIAVALPLTLACGTSDSASDVVDDTGVDSSRLTDLEYPSDDTGDLPPTDTDILPEDAADTIPADGGADAIPCPFVTSDFGFRDNCDGTVTDTNTGLTWEKSFQWAAGLVEAKRLCVQSRAGGLKGWRLPTIDELRSLVVGCPATAPEGACVVHHAATTCEDHESTTCFNQDCYGCPMNQGPVVNPLKDTQHCYMDATFEWYCNLFWSSTQVKPKAGVKDDLRSWYLTFYNAGIDVPPSMAQVQSSAMRCVRGP